MFERTASLWRRLTHQHVETSANEIATEERRVWVRHPCDLQIQYAPDVDEPPLAARIVNISRGGVQLAVGQPHELGSLISVELPGADGQTSLAALACVVHQNETNDGEWLLGCSFSRELEPEQLESFCSIQEPACNKRHHPRYPAPISATVQLTNSNDSKRWPATVLNLSAGGVALVVEHDIRNGTLLTADLCGVNGHAVETILICVVHLTRQEDGSRRSGCNFIRELEEKDLRLLLV